MIAVADRVERYAIRSSHGGNLCTDAPVIHFLEAEIEAEIDGRRT